MPLPDTSNAGSPPLHFFIRLIILLLIGLPGSLIWCLSAFYMVSGTTVIPQLLFESAEAQRKTRLLLIPLFFGVPPLLLLGHTMYQSSLILAQFKEVKIPTTQLVRVTVMEATPGILYCIALGALIGLFGVKVASFYTLSVFIGAVSIALLARHTSHALKKLRTKWEKEARDALPQAIDPETPISTPPR